MTEPVLSIFSGPPLASEPGLGALTLPGYFREVTTRFARHEAIAFRDPEGGEVRWTYAELYQRAHSVASALVAGGLALHERVAILATNRPEWLIGVFGTLLAGGSAVPLSTFSTEPELTTLLKASGASTLLFEPQVLKKDFGAMLLSLAPGIGRDGPGTLTSPEFPFLRRLVATGEADRRFESWEALLQSGAGIDPDLIAARSAQVTPGDPGMVYFSSGSTGTPKGIVNSHRGVTIQLWRWRRLFALPDDGSQRGWGGNGFFWSGAFVQTVGAMFSCGGTLVLQPTFVPERTLDLIEQERITYLTCWPHQYAQLAEAPNFDRVDLSSLEYITRDTALERHPTLRTDFVEPVATYGSTETFTISTGIPVAVPHEEWGGSNGVVLPGNTVKVVDPFSSAIMPVGESGEIAVKGPTLMLSYVGKPADESLDEQGFFRTGDQGRFDAQGRLYFEGRLNDIIKTGGANVSPREVDKVIMEMDGVSFSQTVGIPDDLLGERIVSCIVPVEGARPDAATLVAALRTRLASYKVPRDVLFVEKDELSFTGSAKVMTAALREFVQKRLRP